MQALQMDGRTRGHGGFKGSHPWSTAENVKKAQQEDSDIGPLVKWKEENRPRPGLSGSPTLKAMRALWESLPVGNVAC